MASSGTIATRIPVVNVKMYEGSILQPHVKEMHTSSSKNKIKKKT